MDRDDIEVAIEIAIGDNLSHEGFKPRTVTAKEVERWVSRFKRVLRELPAETTVHEMLEALDE